jgi:hypothetical protein
MRNPDWKTRRAVADDSGAAMIFVLLWSVVLVGLVLAVTQVAVNQIRPSDNSEKSYAALAAAEAGIEDYLVRLEQPGYELTVDPANAAFTSFVPVPGGSTPGEFTYSVDASRVRATGELRIFSTGRVDGVERTVETVLSRRSTLDYVYLSDIETPAPDVPGAYSTRRGSGGTSSSTGRELAERLCTRRWYESGSVSPGSSTGNQRNLSFCQWAGIYSSERIAGRIHTNDVWRLEDTDLTRSLDADAISSSCRSPEEGLAPGEPGCPANRRYLTTRESRLNSNSIESAGWSSRTGYQGDSFRPTDTVDRTGRNPRYEPVLELPTTSLAAAELKARASESGCIFTGPTRLRFDEVGGRGVVYVTSPDTKLTGPDCGSGYEDISVPHTTRTVYLDEFEDLIIYVQDVPTPGVDDPNNAFDTPNAWTPGSEPTCRPKVSAPSPAGNIYPFVVPSDSGESVGFARTGRPQGFPSYYADVDNPWYADNCSRGDAYVQGEVKGRVTIATDNNIVLTSSLRDSTASLSGAETGKPADSSATVIGLVSGEFTYLYRPTAYDRYAGSGTNAYPWVRDWRRSNADDPILNVAILAVDGCFAAQDPYYAARSGSSSSRNGDIYLWGSLSQKYRCVVGYTGGYSKSYRYDERLGYLSPPFFSSVFSEPWRTRRTGELTPQRQSLGAMNYPITLDGSQRIVDAQMVAGPARVSLDEAGLVVIADEPGQVVVRYRIAEQGSVVERRLVIRVE